VFGDSLAYQAWGEIERAVRDRGYELMGEAVPGDAICDATPRVADVMARRPAYVVLAYVGNNNAPCTGRTDGEQLGEVYERSLVENAELTRDARLVVVGPPDIQAPDFVERVVIVRARYQAVARRFDHVEFVDGRSYLSPDGYAATLPCRPAEGRDEGCVGGRIAVRLDDGLHLSWPNEHGYSGGAVRWADAIVSSVPPR